MTKEEIINQLQSRWVTRAELSVFLGLGDSAAREWIASLNEELHAKGSCIVSTAGRRGYHIPDFSKDEDKALMEHAIAELRAKAISILQRAELLEDTVKNSRFQQLSLF